MWQRFTERTRRAVVYAQEAAAERGENLVKPEHLLLGVLRGGDTIACRLLTCSGVAPADLIAHLDLILTPGPGRDGSPLRLDLASRRVLDLAAVEARRRGNLYIGTEHLLLGIIAADSGATGITFREFGPDLASARRSLEALADAPPAPRPLPAPAGNGGLALRQRGVSGGGAAASRHRAPSLGRDILLALFLILLFAFLLTLLRGG